MKFNVAYGIMSLKGGEIMPDIKLKTFPDNQYEALTIMHLQSNSSNNMTPEELVRLYRETYIRIVKAFSAHQNEGI